MGAVSLIVLSGSPAALHAEPSLAELAAQIQALRAENQQMHRENSEMKSAIADMRGETRRTRQKVREVAERRPAGGYAAASPSLVPVMPANAVPVFATADKKLQIGSITITPGGFFAMESAFRSRTEQADIGSQYQAIPFGPQSATNELRFSARQSRVAALIEAPIAPGLLVSGYGEFDFLGSGVTSNQNESNSFVPRIRHLYATLDAPEMGLHFLAGQEWSLLTLDAKGITPRTEVTPPTIDAQYVPGFVWKRQPQVRVVKEFNNGFWLGVSAEASQNTFTGCTNGVNGTTITGVTGGTSSVTCDLLGNNNLNGIAGTTTTNFSLDHVPDVVGKAAYDAHFADRTVHFEAEGIYRDLYVRVANATLTQASNIDTTGYGFGGSMIVPVVPKRLDFQASVLAGRGIGSYGTAQFTDATFSSNGGASPLREEMVLGGLTFHATPAIDVYAFGGLEQVQPDYYTTNAAGTAFAGYGAPSANNSGCFNDVAAATCGGNAKRVWQITGGLWDKAYKGPFGEVRVGLQYSYTERELFQGFGTTAPAAALPFAPKQNDQSILTSFRYYPFN